MNRKRASRKILTAYHEAGHAVAAYLLRKRFRYVTIVSSGAYDGYVMHGQGRRAPLPEWELNRRTRSAVEKDIMVSLAGSAAISILTGKRDSTGSWFDRHTAAGLAEDRCGSRRECEAYMSWLSVRCTDLLRSPANWHAVETLAEELLLRGSIDHTRAAGIIRSAKRQFRERGWKAAAGQVIPLLSAGR